MDRKTNRSEAHHRCSASSLSRRETTISRAILSKHWEMTRKKSDGKSRPQHGPMTCLEVIKSEGNSDGTSTGFRRRGQGGAQAQMSDAGIDIS